MLSRLWRKFRADERGGPVLVLAFSVIAVTVIMGLGAAAMANGAVTHQQRATQSAEASVRSAVDSILAELNQGGKPPQEILNGLAGREFTLDQDSPVTTSIVGTPTLNGQTVDLNLKVDSEGRVPWVREGSTTLKLANAVSLARVDAGRAVWDFTPPTGANSKPGTVVALWTAGELSIFVPGVDQETPSAPNPPTVTSDMEALAGGSTRATFVATYGGGCARDEDHTIEMRASVNGAPFGEWNEPKTGDDLSPAQNTRFGDMAAGQSVTVETRVRCVGGAERGNSNWTVVKNSITRWDGAPRSTSIPLDVVKGENGVYTVTTNAGALDALPDGTTALQQVRFWFGDKDANDVNGLPWKTYSDPSVSLSIPEGNGTLHIQSRTRMSNGKEDTGWLPLIQQDKS